MREETYIMKIRKRNGELVEFIPGKIKSALEKAFVSQGKKIAEEELHKLLTTLLSRLPNDEDLTVELVQDEAERVLMEYGWYDVAKAYILYREKRSILRQARASIIETVSGDDKLDELLRIVQSDFNDESYSLSALQAKFDSFYKPSMNEEECYAALVKAAVELTTPEAPNWEFIASRLLNYSFQNNLTNVMNKYGITCLYEKIRYMCDKGLYGDYILTHYSRIEIDEAEGFIVKDRDKLFTYSGLDLLLKRYVIHDYNHVPLETPQEMFMGIALHLCMNEKIDRMKWVKRTYDMLSRLEVTMATPTMSNARKPYHQLSSCFIDMVPDSLDGIYRSLDNFAKVSKLGGGMGMYFGKVRATGSTIRGFKGAAGGVIRWIRLVNDTAVAVDQLGMRQGAVAVYLDVWHKDLPEFLQLRTNNGDDRMKAHDVFPAVCYPDLFWKLADENIDAPWYLMCPHEILAVKGYSLEDYYGEEWEKRYYDCVNDSHISKRTVSVKDIVRLVLRSAVETGTPFAFNRDTVNRMNPNGHAGMIYCSNLCTEIAQNMAPIEYVSTNISVENGDTVLLTTTRPGDFVVCNLASLSLGNLPLEDDEYMQRTIETAVRALDNVIDLNFYPLEYAKLTNHKYRSIGLGVSGYHHMLAKRNIKWESEEHLKFVDEVFERINYAAIKADNALAIERGAYKLFDGSDWQNGDYFKKRGYTSEKWKDLQRSVCENGMRNAYLLAIAPTSSTSVLSGTTAGVDPVMKRFYLEEKRVACCHELLLSFLLIRGGIISQHTQLIKPGL